MSQSKRDHSLSTRQISLRLGWVSFFNDASSEVMSRVLPLIIVTLGASPVFVGLVEGFAESLSIFLRVFSGWYSDKMKSRKPLVVIGYTLSLFSRVGMILSSSAASLAFSRSLDRTGKGLRQAPRDAMIADFAEKGSTGLHYGLNRFLDTLGGVIGILIVLIFGVGGINDGALDLDGFHKMAWIALPFSVIAVAMLIFAVPKVPRLGLQNKLRFGLHAPRGIRRYLIVVGVFAMSQSSDAFLVLRAQELGMTTSQILVYFLIFNLLAAALAYPIGRLSDRLGKFHFLSVGWLIYAFCYYNFGSSKSIPEFALFLVIYGCFYGFTDGVEKALLADRLQPEERGLGFGVFQLILGVAALPSSLLMGWMMTSLGSKFAFSATAVIAVMAWLFLPWALKEPTQVPPQGQQ